jgi:hypothetical protein
MYRVYAIVGMGALALTIVIAMTTCMITQPPTVKADCPAHAISMCLNVPNPLPPRARI